ncbi:type II secretion system F family protein [Luteolibacter marinus]|uniref:type II secretion system F family protein n=1 Tax=Luteolibacter marinus TaxID=2776705 RepID=UPI0018660FFB|nr:type II secretion system F family protein [Luteolibacter marinus]
MSSATVTAKPAAPAAAQGSFSFLKQSKVKQFNKKQLISMFRGLGSMLRAQINTADALKYYAQGLQDKMMADTLNKIREDINAGVSVHEAFRRTGRFSEMVVGLVQAGSDAGQLHQAFTSLASRFTSELHFNKAIKKATVMPGVIISVLTGAFIFSQLSIVPQVQDMLKQVSQTPDGMTAIAFKVSAITKACWPYFVIGVIAFGITVWRSNKVRNFILGLGMSKWRLLRMMILSLRQMTFLSTMKMLHANGINLAKSIRVAANSVKGTPFYQELRDAADKYEHSGVPLSSAFSKYTSVDSQVVHMMSIGEKSASLDNQLEMLSQMYEEDSANYMSSFTATVNFLVLIIAVGLIAAVFVGTFLPIFLMGPKMMNSGI